MGQDSQAQAPAFDPSAPYQAASTPAIPAFNPSAPYQTAPVTQIRYTAPGQGVQEFVKGSTDEQQFLQRFPGAKAIPGSYQRPLQPNEQVDTETPATRTARQTKQGKQMLETTGALAGSIIAPELLPEAAGLLATSAATAGGAALGTAAGQTAIGENPVSKENLEESGKNAAIYGGGNLVFGAGGKLLGKVADRAKELLTPVGDIGEEGNALVEKIAGQPIDQQKVVAKVQQDLGKAEQKLHQDYEAKFNQISQRAQNLPVDINQSPLQQAAQKLLVDTKIPENIRAALKGVAPDSERLIPLLEEFTGKEGSPTVYTFDEIEGTRQVIGDLFRKTPYGSPLKPDLYQLRSAIDDTLEKAVTDAGPAYKPVLDDMKALRANYADKIGSFHNKAIEALQDKSPDMVADILMNKQNSIERVKDLQNLIGEENMKPVEGSILDRLIQKATVGSGDTAVINADKLRNAFSNISPNVRQAIWGENLPAVTDFMEGVVRNNTKGVASRRAIALLSKYGLGNGAAGGGLTGGIIGLVRGDDPEKFLRDVAIGTTLGAAPNLITRFGPSAIEGIEGLEGAASAIKASGAPLVAERAAEASTASAASGEQPSAPPAKIVTAPREAEVAPDVPSLIDKASATYGIPANLLRAQAGVESGFDNEAESPKGAKGVMQLMPKTAEALGVDPEDPEQNVDGGARYLSQLHKRFGRYDRALAAYNWGPSNVQTAIDKHGDNWLEFAPIETQRYVHQILRRAIQ